MKQSPWLLDWFNIPSAQAEDRVTVMTLSSIIEQMNATLMSFQVLVTATASISLLVGGIGIMNMMLTNVTERIREIGLRKALGARASDITKQFLCESILICIMGGVDWHCPGLRRSMGPGRPVWQHDTA